MFSPVTRLSLLMALCVVLFGSGTTAAGRQRAPEPSWAETPRWLVWAINTKTQKTSTSSVGEQELAASFRAPCEMTLVQTNLGKRRGQRTQLELILDLGDIDPSKVSVKANPDNVVVTLQALPERVFLATRRDADGCAGSRCAWDSEVSGQDREYDVVFPTGEDVEKVAQGVAYAFRYASWMCGKRSDTPPPMA